MIKFSIVTPSFNQAKFIDQTINSVINQKGDFKIEYFVMDGGSTDGTIEILKKYEQELKGNSRISFNWKSKNDKGQSDAINQGFKKATGDILAYINSDDYYEPDIFSKVAKNFIANPNNLWLTGYSRIINENSRTIQKSITAYKNFWLNCYSYNTILILNYISQPSTFFKRSLYQEAGPFDEKMHLTMDYNFWLTIGKSSHPIILKSYLSNFRIHTSSKGKKAYIEQFAEDYHTVKKHTKNGFLLFLHRIHNRLIIFVYRLIK